MGNYASVGDSYTKGESDGRYPLNTDFENAIKASNDGLTQRYTKTESDNLFQPKGTYATLSDIENKVKSFPSVDNVYTKVDSDGKFQPKGDYALVGASYTKGENDSTFATFATKTDLNNAAKSATDTFATITALNNAASSATATFQPKGSYALVGASYTKVESDGLYPTKGTFDAAIKTGADGLAARYTKAEVDTKVTSLVNNNTLTDLKPKTMWCADGEFCQVPAGKKGFTNGAIIIHDNTIKNDTGRMHISGNERLYLLNKDGVIIGKEWGGNGNLQIQGSLYVQGRDILDELNRCIKVGDPIAIRSGRNNNAGLVQGSDATNVGAWEQLRIERR